MRKAESEPRVRGGTLWFLAPLIAIWLIPVAVASVLIPFSFAADSAALTPPRPATVEVGSREDSARQAVDVQVATQESISVRSSGSGLVTDVLVQPGTVLANGQPILVVNGVSVLAYTGPSPFFRDLSTDAEGADVGALGNYLAALGLLDPSDVSTSFDWVTREAVKELQARIGAPIDGVFYRSAVVWIPAEVMSFSTLEVGVGDSISDQSIIANGPAVARSVRFTLAGDATREPVLPAGQLHLLVGDAVVPVASMELSAEEQESVYNALVAGVQGGTVAQTDEVSQVLFSGALLELATPVRLGTVPSSSLLIGPSGGVCLFKLRDGNYSITRVDSATLVSGEMTLTGVSVELVGTTISADPFSLSAETRTLCK